MGRRRKKGGNPAETLRLTVAGIYAENSEGLSEEDAMALGPEVDNYLELLRTELLENALIDIDLAERIGETCKALLAKYREFNKHGKASVVGAIRYFIEIDDADCDLDSKAGFEDDAEVVNFVIALTRADIPKIEINN